VRCLVNSTLVPLDANCRKGHSEAVKDDEADETQADRQPSANRDQQTSRSAASSMLTGASVRFANTPDTDMLTAIPFTSGKQLYSPC
jgi:hypothetical protein